MKNYLIYITVLCSLITSSSSWAQSPFIFESDNISYKALDGGKKLFGNGSPIEVLENEIIHPIGFQFKTPNSTFSNVEIFMGAMDVLDDQNPYHHIQLSLDFPDKYNIEHNPIETEINHKLIGEPGTQISIFEYKNLQLEEFPNEFFDAQIWFHENGNIIEVKYGGNNFSEINPMLTKPLFNYISESFYDQYNMTVDLKWVINLGGSPTAPKINLSMNEADLITLNQFPEAGTVYRYKNVMNSKFEDSFSFENKSDVITISSIQSDLNIDVFKIYDLNGKIIFSENVNTNKFRLDISNYQPGVYLITIKSENGYFTNKVIR
jgi:hypothetical protein